MKQILLGILIGIVLAVGIYWIVKPDADAEIKEEPAVEEGVRVYIIE